MKRLDDQLWGQVAGMKLLSKPVTSVSRDTQTCTSCCMALMRTPRIPLYVAGDSGDKFERDALDVFIVNSLWVGEIMKLRVGHDAVGLGSGGT